MSDWFKWMLLGVLSAIFGVLVLNHAIIFSLAITTVVGALFLVSGIIQALAGFWDEGVSSKALSIVLGVVMALIGLSFLTDPLSGTLSLALLVTILIAAGGILRLMFALRMKGSPVFWAMILSGIVSLGLAVYILLNPALGVVLLGTLLGVELIFNGVGLVTLGLWKRTHPMVKPDAPETA
ncbi:MAG: DUF308 domain-containing protein [Pseudomonadota bacterium]